MKERFGGRVEAGKLVLDEPLRWRGILGRHTDKRVVVSIEKEKRHRSLRANAYLWGVVYKTIAEWSGHDVDDVHQAMKEKFLAPRELMLPTGEELPLRGSTAILDSADFADYVAKVKLWAGECGVHVPEPDEVEVSL